MAGCRAVSSYRAQDPEACSLHLCAAAHQGCSDPEHYHVCAGMCPQQKCGARRWSPRTFSTMQRQKQTPRNTIHTCKPQGKSFHRTTDRGHKKAHLLDPTSPQILGAVTWVMSKHLSTVRNHNPEYVSLLFCLPSKRQKTQEKSSSTHFYLAKQRIIHHQLYPCKGTKALSEDISPRGR